MAAKGKLLCSYPGPAITVPRHIVDQPTFRKELASFLAQMNVDILDSAPTTKKASSEVREERDTAHPRYITQLLTEILRGMGQVADVTRIRKRIADDVLWSHAFKPWRRSPIWLLIRVALQTSLYREFEGHEEYKFFMVFMMAKILRMCLEEDFPSDLIFWMRAKMSRRLFKLGVVAPEFVVQYVRIGGEMAQDLLETRWLKLQRDQAASALWAPNRLNFSMDIHLSLVNSKPHLTRVIRGTFPHGEPYLFRPNHFRRFQDSSIFDANNTDLLSAFTENGHIGLLDFEVAVEDHLDDWIARNLMRPSSCIAIAACITQYSAAARAVYKSNPETLSMMLLTIFDLWVGLDKMAVAQCPLLREYSPEVPLGLLEALLLRRSKSFHRLKLIEDYVRKRHSVAHESVFTDGNSFAVRYYDMSEEHKLLRERIERDATTQRQAKREELHRLNAEHENLRRRSDSLDHTFWINNRGTSVHAGWWSCTKCSLESQLTSMSIDVHEWPLPQDLPELKVVVFELLLPLQFSTWRATTCEILRDICLFGRSVTPSVQLGNYVGLRNYTDEMLKSRITLASDKKSFSNSHYRTTRIPSNESSACVNNGLNFRCIVFKSKRFCIANDYIIDCLTYPEVNGSSPFKT